MRGRSLFSRSTIGALMAALACLAMASSASAFSITEFSASSSSSVAGAHPDFTTNVQFSRFEFSQFSWRPDGNVRDVTVDTPPGLVGDPNAVPQCGQLDFLGNTCPTSAQVGIANVGLITPSGFPIVRPVPVLNMKPSNDSQTAELAFSFLKVKIHLAVSSRTDSDYGLKVTSLGTSRQFAVSGVELTLWGDPGDPIHDSERFDMVGNPVPRTIGRAPFMTNPTSCSGPLEVSVSANSYQEPEVFDHATAQLPPMTGCESVPFAPEFSFKPNSSEPVAWPSGFESVLKLPQSNSPDGQATGALRNAVVKLPEGVTVNPSSAVGLSGCGDADLKLGSTAAATCPDSAQIGTASFDVPVLPAPFPGKIYLRDPEPGSLFRIALVGNGFGIHTKIAGVVKPDPVTGQLTATFDDTPQVPLRELDLQFDDGPRAPLMMPSSCGTYNTEAVLTSWSGKTVSTKSSFDVTGNAKGQCAPGFDLGLSAGTTDPLAGAFSPFVLRLTRDDGSQPITGLTADLPKGLLGSLKGIPYCPDSVLAGISGDENTGQAQIDNPSCPAASQVGTVTVGAGGGSNPFYTSAGRAYLAGPYKGAPLSLAVVTPAVAGPFDLGNVVIRNALRIDPVTAAVTTVSDPIPTILHGVPLNIRDIRVELQRDDFTLNPTSCDPMAVDVAVNGAGGASASLSNRFRAVDCAKLGFKPKLALKFSGPTRRSAHPALKATLTMPKGNANIGKAVVTLPKTEFLENAHIRTVCTRVQYAANQCPKGSVYGYAKAWTPLLDKPLRGPVYLRSSNHTLPDLVASLDGQIHIDLAGRIDSPGGKLRTTFWAVPDAPVSKFVLNMQGGDKGLLVNNTELCRRNPRAKAEFSGQNGKLSNSNPLVKIGCEASPRKR